MPAVVPLTARELRELHGLTVEEGLRRGYCIEGYQREYRQQHNAALEQERRALEAPWYGYLTDCHRNTPGKPETFETTAKEDDYTMENSTRITLLCCLMDSGTFNAMGQAEKALLLTELLYGDKPANAPAAKQPGGRPKKAAVASDGTEGEQE